jgi:hypothetical protein
VMRSNSYKSKGFNEMTFEDATGAENLFVHAQKDPGPVPPTVRFIELPISCVWFCATSTARFAPTLAGMVGHTAGLMAQAAQVAGLGGPAGDALGLMAGPVPPTVRFIELPISCVWFCATSTARFAPTLARDDLRGRDGCGEPFCSCAEGSHHTDPQQPDQPHGRPLPAPFRRP